MGRKTFFCDSIVIQLSPGEVDSGQWSVVSGQWVLDIGYWARRCAYSYCTDVFGVVKWIWERD
jgi:hypothetical protein